jgi:hypothetical protein
MSSVDLTEDELEVAEASVSFAIQNCPVEGVLAGEDGVPVTIDGLQALLERIEAAEGQAGALRLGEGDLGQLKVVIEYTNENCPVENVSTFHDGRPMTGRDMMALARKLTGSGEPSAT